MANIDTFGTAMLGSGPTFRARLIQTGPTTFGLFPDGDRAPQWLNLQDVPTKKGRQLAGITDEGVFSFQRASCGCQTPMHLRGPKRTFLAKLETADV
jgi:hypothetical protein